MKAGALAVLISLLAGQASALELASRLPAVAALPEPTGEVLLSRAAAQSVPLPQIAEALSAAPDADGAVTALARLKLAQPGELRADSPAGAAAMQDALQTLWGEASRHVKDEARYDARWAVPALVVASGDRTYYIHGLAHGFFDALGRRDARRLASQVQAAGAPLLVEQNLPGAYGLTYGREVVSSADDRFSSPFFAALTRALGRPAHWLLYKGLSAAAGLLGRKDLRRYLGRVASVVYGARHPRWQDVRALELPMPLKASFDWKLARRSRDLAREAKAADAKEVHILTGWSHVFDLSWLLSQRS